jgi:hypothetical protein
MEPRPKMMMMGMMIKIIVQHEVVRGTVWGISGRGEGKGK